MTYDFDRLIDRRGTHSDKWQKYGPDVLPLWIADMDFQSPEPVIRALRGRVEHGVFGYLAFEQPEFHQLFADRLLKRYGWRVSPDAVVIIPGVIPGFNVAGRVLAASGDGLILQTPVYPPILQPPATWVSPARRPCSRAGRTGATRSTSTGSRRRSAIGRASSSSATRTTPSAGSSAATSSSGWRRSACAAASRSSPTR